YTSPSAPARTAPCERAIQAPRPSHENLRVPRTARTASSLSGVGLLDDAIREHLDLKRRRGADPAEVERAEREALGPVRRNREPGEMLDPDEPLAVEGGVAYDEGEDWAHDALPPEADVASPLAGAAPAAPEPVVHD